MYLHRDIENLSKFELHVAARLLISKDLNLSGSIITSIGFVACGLDQLLLYTYEVLSDIVR